MILYECLTAWFLVCIGGALDKEVEQIVVTKWLAVVSDAFDIVVGNVELKTIKLRHTSLNNTNPFQYLHLSL